MKETVKWNRCRRPLKVMKDCPGKLRVVISQYGFSYSPGGHWHMKPPASRLTHLPPFLHTPGIHRPDDAFSSQWSPMRKKEGNPVQLNLWAVLHLLYVPRWLFSLCVSSSFNSVLYWGWHLYCCLGLNWWHLLTPSVYCKTTLRCL